jgi:hypothetical protein
MNWRGRIATGRIEGSGGNCFLRTSETQHTGAIHAKGHSDAGGRATHNKAAPANAWPNVD